MHAHLACRRPVHAPDATAEQRRVAHTARALTEDDPDLVILALDAKNAYGTASRADCLDALSREAPELLQFAQLFCCRTSRSKLIAVIHTWLFSHTL